jgi:oxygen-independent coproporphyrinogen-3 oxidase
MEPKILEKYESRRVPRYTSYPTSPHFRPVDEATYRDWLAAIPAGASLSFYLHVPFCHSLCWYCGCHTKIPGHYDPIARYLAALRDEIDMVAAALPGPMRAVHVHWGGGTPTIAAPQALAALMARLRRRFVIAAGAELAIEIDPRTLSAETAAALGGIGVNRASLGVQTFDPVVQRAINRIQSFDQTRAAVEALRSNGVGHFNFDLLYGLPHQTVAMCEETARRALELRPNRLAVFGYAHVPAMKPHQKRLDEAALPGAGDRLAQAEAIAAVLCRAGYVRIGLDHFARPDDDLVARLSDGTLRRNFQGYTTDCADILLGFGASSIGSLPSGYVQNAVSTKAYGEAVAAGRLPVARAVPLTADDRFRREMIERIMCFLEVDIAEVAANHGVDPRGLAAEREALRAMAEDGIIALRGEHIRINEAFRPLVRAVAATFDAYLAPDAAARHSLAV